MHFQNHRSHIETLIAAALRAADPAERLAAHWPRIAARIERARRCWVAGAGKAALEMSLKVNELLGERIAAGAVAAVPERLQTLDSAIRDSLPFQLYPAAHPLPDERNLLAARAIADVAARADDGDALIVLLSGGGSAHLTLPANGLALADLQRVTGSLMKAGAPIEALNTVRKHCERLKGGGLLRLAAPARVFAFVLSDVIGDPLDVIASGPATPDPTRYADALDVLTRYGVEADGPVRRHLEAGARGERPETLKPDDPLYALADHTLIGSNALAVEAVKREAERLGFAVAHLETGVRGEAREAGARLGEWAVQHASTPQCAIFGGETTVTVTGPGRGGRNQEMALAAAIAIEGLPNLAIAAFATDGIDGPTDAAGAIATGDTCGRARAMNHDPADYLNHNDSHTFFAELGDSIRTGPTGTNVNDIALALAYPE
ncbi:MAG: DUF4147 domain-containing protein [Chloroflexi bacterium]|nr:DUF4147 domain-containing protein [Chloroflexota bacterium]